jgi:predicted DNA-binding protein
VASRKPRTPKATTIPIATRVTPETAEALNAVAAREGTTRARLMREICEEVTATEAKTRARAKRRVA